jgi:predicted RNA binding protein YcfA (HicA-like mRNA interferase family)
MSPLPVVRAAQLVAALRKLGFEPVRQSGSHLVLKRAEPPARVVVPMHAGRDLKRGTLAAILADAGIDAETLRAHL